MKNKILFTAFALLLFIKVNAQITISATSNCISTRLTATAAGLPLIASGLVGDNAWSNKQTIGFNFKFYGNNYTKCIISSNGCLGFDTTFALAYNTWFENTILLHDSGSAGDIHNLIAGPWADMYLTAGGMINTSVVGVAPNRKYVLYYCGVAMYTCATHYITSQIVLYETSNNIEVHIAHYNYCPTPVSYAIVGVKNQTGTKATTAPGRDYPSLWDATNESWRFIPIGDTTYNCLSIPYSPVIYMPSAIYWYDSSSGLYLGSGTSITVYPTIPTGYKAAALGCMDTTWSNIHINPPSRIIYGPNTVCTGENITLSDSIAGGTWSLSNTAIATVTSDGILHGLSIGSDTVLYNDTIGSCSSFSIINVIHDSTCLLNISKKLTEYKLPINIYPNPVTDIYTLTIDDNNYNKLKIFNSIGELLFEQIIDKPIIEINFDRFPKGIYFIKLFGETCNRVKKIIKV